MKFYIVKEIKKMASGAQKTTCKIPYVKGTKPSLQNAQLLISTGIPSLDHIIGGGLPIGSILLIEEDTYGNYSEIMLKYFMAEGIVTSQALLVASQNTKPSQLLSEVPAVVSESPETTGNILDSKKQMQIAWRYQNMRQIDSFPTGSQVFGHYYDLTKKMDETEINLADVTFWDGENVKLNAETFKNSAYVDLLKTVHEKLKNGEFLVSSCPNERNILRIAIQSLGSRLWLSDKEEDSHNDLLKFLYFFRALLRNSFAVATITFPAHFFDNSDALVERMEHSSDFVVGLESFAGSIKETNPIFKDYHGLLHLKKIPAFNTLAPYSPHSMDLAFKMRRKKFLIEILHLPPQLGDTTEREQDDIVGGMASCCSSGTNKKKTLDF